MPAVMDKLPTAPPRMPTHRKFELVLGILYLILAWSAIILWATGQLVNGVYCVLGALACGALAVNLSERCD